MLGGIHVHHQIGLGEFVEVSWPGQEIRLVDGNFHACWHFSRKTVIGTDKRPYSIPSS